MGMRRFLRRPEETASFTKTVKEKLVFQREFRGENVVIRSEAIETYCECEKTAFFTEIIKAKLGLLAEVCLYSAVYVKNLSVYKVGST